MFKAVCGCVLELGCVLTACGGGCCLELGCVLKPVVGCVFRAGVCV